MSEEYKNFVNLGIVQNKNSEVLIIKRKIIEEGIGGVKLTWAFPGGKQKNENREECVAREILSETGYKVKVIRQISLRVHPQITKILCYFLCDLIDENRIQEPEEEHEVEEIKWVKPEELKNYFTTDLDPNVAKELKIS